MNYEQAKEIIPTLRFEYYAAYAAARADDEAHDTQYAEHFVDFYDYLTRRSISRHMLSALGVSRANALEWRG